jgi:hypothetical protein
MANILKRFKNLLAWSQTSPEDLLELVNPSPETIKRWQEITEPFAIKGDGKAEVMPMMTEDEMNTHIKESELGWGEIFDKVRNLGKDGK